MKIFNFFKKKPIGEKLNCGSINTETGEFSRGYMVDGKIVYKYESTDNVWGEPVYHSVVTRTWEQDVGSLFSTVMRKFSDKVALYKETNRYNDKNRYFFRYNHCKNYIDTDAFEKSNTIILVRCF